MSCTCGKEYDYNLALAKYIETYLQKNSINAAVQNGEITFEDRYKSSENEDLFISIHHDSMQEQFIKRDKNSCPSSRYASGFSIFVSRKNIAYQKSLMYAKKLGKILVSSGLKPSLHHAEKIKGESRELLDVRLGVYAFDDLKVLKNAKSPAILLEAGVIVNPDDESRVKTKVFMNVVSKAI